MSQRPTEVQLFATCLIEAIRPEAGLAVVTVLEHLGLRVIYPQGQTCCGQPAFNAGAWGDARSMARHTVDVLSASNAPVVVPSGSCADMIVHQYPELLAADADYGPRASALAARTYEFTHFIAQELGLDPGALGALAARAPARRVTYHPACHLLRGLNNRAAPLQLLAAAPNLEVVGLPEAEACCGFGGLFAVKMSAVSGAMLERKLDNIERTGADTVVACDVSCLLHIGGGLHRRGSKVAARHLAEVLASDAAQE